MRASDRLSRRETRALTVSRGAAATALIGTFVLPTLANLAAFVMLLSFALLPSAERRLRAVLATPLGRAVLLLLAVLTAATFWSEAQFAERFGALWSWRPLLLFVVCLAIFDGPSARRNALLAFIVVAAVGATYSFWAWVHGYSSVTNNHGLPGIVWRNPVTQGMAFALACFLAMMLAITQRDIERRLRAALVLASLFLLANLVFVTSGRSGHLLLLILFAATALQMLRGWRRVAAIACLPPLAALALQISPMLQTRFGLLVEELRAPLAAEGPSAMGIRSVIWKVSVQMVRERPFLGYGMGGFAPAYQRAVQASPFVGWAARPSDDPHNQYLRVQLQAGLAGTAAFAWFLVAVFRYGSAQPYRAWAIAILLGWCAASLATSLFTTFAEGHMLMLSLGILLSGPMSGRQTPPDRVAEIANEDVGLDRGGTTRRGRSLTASMIDAWGRVCEELRGTEIAADRHLDLDFCSS